MAEIRTSYLSSQTLSVNGRQRIGAAPNGKPGADVGAGGGLHGPKLKSTVLPGGAGRIMGRRDGSTTPEVRILPRTKDGAVIAAGGRPFHELFEVL